MASEEDETIIQIPEEYPRGKYVLAYDPLDGSTNIDSNGAVGTIFGLFRRISPGEGTHGTVSDLLQPARKLVAAGYVIYGPSTMLVYSTGFGVHGFTLDPSVGEFILSHENMKLPDKPRYYAANQGWQKYWTPGVRRYVEWLQALDGSDHAPLGLRYSGTMIADFHRNLLNGGVYFYPAEEKDGKRNKGKIRLLYEAGPLAYLIEQAGGYASNGRQNILDIQPLDLHQRVPFFIGSRELVKQAEKFLAEEPVLA
jgi:fructose-1,6-bisphosphatase I